MTAEKKTKAKWALGAFFLVLFLSLWKATQALAWDCDYDLALGGWLFGYKDTPVYNPFNFIIWYFKFGNVIPSLFADEANWLFYGFCGGMFAGALVMKQGKVMDTHGTASWATKLEIIKTNLMPKQESLWKSFMRKQGFYQHTPPPPKSKGVILGRSPYGKKDEKSFLKHDGPEHIIVMAPTRSGKGVGIIIPTLLEWEHSVFVTDIKGENWNLTAGYRQKHLGNKVLKFDPTAKDGSSVKYNPLAEIRLRTKDEVRDVQNICDMLVDPNGDSKPDHWSRTSHNLLVGIITHLCYVYDKEGRGCPSLSDVASFLSRPDMPIEEALEEMKEYPHITAEEFLSDENVFEKIYGEYIKDLNSLKAELKKKLPMVKIRQPDGSQIETDEFDPNAEELKIYLTHPKVAEAAATILNKPDNERGSVISTAISFLGLYQDPVVASNISESEFCIEDLMREDKPVSLYLVIPINDLQRLTPLIRMVINMLLNKLTVEMKFEKGVQIEKKQRCLLLLDEFPAFGNINSMEKGLAYIAGYGLKALLIVQSINQLNKSYTKENSIVDNCHIRVFFTPNDENTPGYISKMLGKKTIEFKTQSGKIGAVFDGSESTSRIARELMTPEEVTQLSKNESIVFVTGNKPIHAQKIFYYEEKYFTEKVKFGAPQYSDKCRGIDLEKEKKEKSA